VRVALRTRGRIQFGESVVGFGMQTADCLAECELGASRLELVEPLRAKRLGPRGFGIRPLGLPLFVRKV
jgi:hypothetical protein